MPLASSTLPFTSSASMSSSLQATSQDTKQFNLRAELVRRHSRLMRKVKPSHDEIVRLLGQRAEMSETAYVENTLDLAQNHPEMLLQVRYAEHAEDFTAKKRKACSEASKAKKQRGLPGVEGEAADAVAADAV